MAYVVDRPNIQLDAADIASITANILSVAQGFPAHGPGIDLDRYDLLALHTQFSGSQQAVNTANINLTAADVAALKTACGL